MNTPHTTSAVFISYAFPPNGGSGVQRVYKFVKYLPHYGVNASVLTARRVLKTTIDSTLLRELHPSTVVVRARSIDPMFVAEFVNRGVSAPRQKPEQTSWKSTFLKMAFPVLLSIRNFLRLPDQYLGWFPFAFTAGLRHLRTVKEPVIVASIPVYSTALVGYCLSKVTGAPLILDFRDAWADDPYLELPTRFHRYLHNALERRIVCHAKHLVVYGEWLEQVYRKKYPEIPVTVILNGFDKDDFPSERPVRPFDGKIRLVYSGSLFQYHREFIELVFATTRQLDASLLDRVEIVFAGEIQLTAFDDLIQQYGLGDKVIKCGYIPHRDAINLLLSADALLFTIPRDDISSYTGKIFEYLAARRPIISFVCANGSGGKLLREFGHGAWMIDYDPSAAAEVFKGLASMPEASINYGAELIARIERKQQALALAQIVQSVGRISVAHPEER